MTIYYAEHSAGVDREMFPGAESGYRVKYDTNVDSARLLSLLLGRPFGRECRK